MTIKIEDNKFYKIEICGTRNFNIDELIECITEENKNICEIKDCTTLPYDFENIKQMKNLKGLFTKKILDEMENMSELEKQETMKTVDLIYQMMK